MTQSDISQLAVNVCIGWERLIYSHHPGHFERGDGMITVPAFVTIRAGHAGFVVLTT